MTPPRQYRRAHLREEEEEAPRQGSFGGAGGRSEGPAPQLQSFKANTAAAPCFSTYLVLYAAEELRALPEWWWFFMFPSLYSCCSSSRSWYFR
jgi:hypothetical protein